MTTTKLQSQQILAQKHSSVRLRRMCGELGGKLTTLPVSPEHASTCQSLKSFKLISLIFSVVFIHPRNFVLMITSCSKDI